MATQFFEGESKRCAGRWRRLRRLAAAGAVFAALATALALPLAAPAAAQDGPVGATDLLGSSGASARSERIEARPSQPPAFSIPVEPLGFSAPGIFYLGQRQSFAFLGFLDEDHLLFVFRVPGLIHRAAGANNASENDPAAGEERPFRVVVLSLPSGTEQAEALWTLHGPARSVWMLDGGRFLLRDGNTLDLGDATLQLKPLLRFPGPLLWLETDPTRQILLTGSREPAAPPATASAEPAAQSASDADNQNFSLEMHDQPPAAPNTDGSRTGNQNAASQNAPPSAPAPDLVVRILSRDSGKVLLLSRALAPVDLPINADGYLDSLRNGNGSWLLRLNYFSGGGTMLGAVDSSCAPGLNFVAPQAFVATTCTPSGDGNLTMRTTTGRSLWQTATSAATIWPLLVAAPNGTRLAREVLVVDAPVNADTTLSQNDILGQQVEVIDAATGKTALIAPASPILDGGGNVAFSPSARRVAILNGGQIQVFELPAAPPLPTLSGQGK